MIEKILPKRNKVFLLKEGLKEEDRYFWTLHIEVEVGHSNAIFNVIEKHLQNQDDQNKFIEGIEQYLHLMEIYWEGIDKKIGNSFV